MGVPALLKTAHMAQEEDHRLGRASEPRLAACLPSQDSGHDDVPGAAPRQGCSLWTAHVLIVPKPLARAVNSHNLHLSAHITFNEPDRHYTILPTTAAENAVRSADD